jgi:hypothetical protein
MPVGERTRRIIWTEAAGTCAMCRERLLEPFKSKADKHFLGEVAHIVAEEFDGPRGQSALTLDERNAEANLLLLCMPHHKKADDDPATYTVGVLQELKRSHAHWVTERMGLDVPWRTKLHNLHYINVPRLNMLAATAGGSLDLCAYGEIEVLHELRLRLGPLMGGFKGLLQRVELKAISLESAVTSTIDLRGAVVSFDREFRTKNVHMPRTHAEYATAVTGDLSRDPHIYAKVGKCRVVLKIDPRWITTSTAFCEFRPSSGKNKFAGLGVVQSVSNSRDEMIISPLVIGLPSNPFMEAFYGSA